MRMIYSDPNFKGVAGNFDPARFQATIRQFGFTEQKYIAEQRRVSLRRQIAGTVSAGLEPPKVLIDALSRFQNEQRTIDYVARRMKQDGLTKKEAIRCVKHHIAREIYYALHRDLKDTT